MTREERLTKAAGAILAASLFAFCLGVVGRAGETGPQGGSTRKASASGRSKSIKGRVVDDSGRPLANANIWVSRVGSSGEQQTAGTDEDGRFEVDNLLAGRYYISAQAPGFVSERGSAKEQHRLGDVVDIRLTKGGVITGTVTNADSEPMVGIGVRASRVRGLDDTVDRGNFIRDYQTDDRGVYRIYGLVSGFYVVAVNSKWGNYYPAGAFDGDAPTYFPSATRDTAAEIIVRAGDEVSGIDIRFRGEAGHAISGVVTGRLPSTSRLGGVYVNLARFPSNTIETNASVQGTAGSSAPFSIYGIADGEYLLTARDTVWENPDNWAASAPRRVTVIGGDVTGIEVALVPLATIAGRIEIATPDPKLIADCKADANVSIAEIVLNAVPREKPDPATRPAPMFGGDQSPRDDKGEFKLQGLFPGPYFIEAKLPAKQWYVSAMILGSTSAAPQEKTATPRAADATRSAINVKPGERMTGFRIVVSNGAALAAGRVVSTKEDGRLPPGLRMLLVPAETDQADNLLRFAEAIVDSDGQFTLTNLPPGRYRILPRIATEKADKEEATQRPWWDPKTRAALRREAQTAGTPLNLKPCARLDDLLLQYNEPQPEPTPRAKPPSR
jgi:protocatechuate 3,4-dioxygenase beta subunit